MIERITSVFSIHKHAFCERSLVAHWNYFECLALRCTFRNKVKKKHQVASSVPVPFQKASQDFGLTVVKSTSTHLLDNRDIKGVSEFTDHHTSSAG